MANSYVRTAVGSLLFLGASLAAQAQVIAVEQIEKSFLVRSEPTLTLLRESPKGRAVLIYIPGGEGRFGLKPDMRIDPAAPPRTSTGRLLAALADPAQTSASLHVVAFDSPYVLPVGEQLSSRATKDHMVRIESVVQHYRERFKLPVVIMGHSNGGFSIAEFLKYLQDKKREDMLSGLVFSAGRSNSSFGSAANLPALFMVAERDGCRSTSPAGAQRIYESFKKGNQAATEFVFVRGGEPEGDPCFSGVHMYNAAHGEAAKIIDDFVVRHVVTAAPATAR